jgi:hypothetical protein
MSRCRDVGEAELKAELLRRSWLALRIKRMPWSGSHSGVYKYKILTSMILS